jgi:hypothetical protein
MSYYDVVAGVEGDCAAVCFFGCRVYGPCFYISCLAGDGDVAALGVFGARAGVEIASANVAVSF